jgi:YjbE family integral membrane protein
MDLSSLGNVHLDVSFFSGLLSIIVINIVLSGDNAVVIAMAVRGLPKEHRRNGILLGSTAAIVLRIVFTLFVVQLLGVNYVKLAGGLIILWIAIKLFVEDEEAVESSHKPASLWHAIWIIVVADLTMALDNVLAVGAASHGDPFLLILGLGLSIPLIVFASSLLSSLMDRYPAIIYIGAALLGKIGAEMILTDPVVVRLIAPSRLLIGSLEIAAAAGVLIVGRYRIKRDLAKQE